MEKALKITIAVLTGIVFYQQYRIKAMEERVFRALKATCESLNLIDKDTTMEELARMYDEEKA